MFRQWSDHQSIRRQGIEEFHAALVMAVRQHGKFPEFNISRGDTADFMQTMVVYTHGLATLAATHALKWSKKDAFCRMNESGIRFLQVLGISRETDSVCKASGVGFIFDEQ